MHFLKGKIYQFMSYIENIQSITINSSGSPITINSYSSVSNWYTMYRLDRDGTTLITEAWFVPPIISDTPGAGSVTYKLYARCYSGSTVCSNRFLQALETKR